MNSKIANENLTFQDLTPKFLQFHQHAAQAHTPEERFELWQEHYGFAAVPPTPEGMEMARKLLDQSWDRYAAVLPELQQNSEAVQKQVLPALQQVMGLLEAQEPPVLQVLTFVGNFEGNPFVVPQEEGTILCLPVEVPLDLYRILLPHELTHVVHQSFGGLTRGWERSIAQVVLEEGLATRVSQHLCPGEPDAKYIEMEQSPGWLARCQEHRTEILQGILPFLAQDRSEVVYRFTMGQGTQGLEREAYFVGWELVGMLLQQGHSFSELARIPAASLPDFVVGHLHTLLHLKETGGGGF